MSVSITLWARQVLLHMAACEQHICQGFRLPSVVKYKVNECLFPNMSLNLPNAIHHLCHVCPGVVRLTAMQRLCVCTSVDEVFSAIQDLWHAAHEAGVGPALLEDGDDDDDNNDTLDEGDASDKDQELGARNDINVDSICMSYGDGCPEESSERKQEGSSSTRSYQLDLGSEMCDVMAAVDLEPAASISPEEAARLSDELWATSVENRISFYKFVPPRAAIVIILTFNRHPPEFTQTLLSSELAHIARACGAQIQPLWANGAKILCSHITQENLQEVALTLCRHHVIVREEDEAATFSHSAPLEEGRGALRCPSRLGFHGDFQQCVRYRLWCF